MFYILPFNLEKIMHLLDFCSYTHNFTYIKRCNKHMFRPIRAQASNVCLRKSLFEELGKVTGISPSYRRRQSKKQYRKIFSIYNQNWRPIKNSLLQRRWDECTLILRSNRREGGSIVARYTLCSVYRLIIAFGCSMLADWLTTMHVTNRVHDETVVAKLMVA